MAFADDVYINLANQIIDTSSTAAGTFYSVQTEYSYYQDAFDELGAVSIPGSLAYPTPMSAATPQDVTVKDGWYRTQISSKRQSGGSVQTDGYDSEIYLLTLKSSGYTNAIGTWSGTPDDLGKTVTGGTSGATGILVDYDNTQRKWWVRKVNATAFQADETLSIGSGTGAGDIESSGGVATGEEGFANAFGLGDVAHWEATYFALGSTVYDLVTGGWYGSAPSSAFNIAIKILEAGSLIASGVAIFFNRCNRDLANSIDSSTTGDTYDWFSVNLSNYGSNPVPLNTRADLADTLTNAQAEDYLDGTTSTIAAATAGAPYAVDIDQDGSTENYDAQLDCDSQTNETVWSAFCKYFFRKGATTTIDGVQAQQFRSLDSSYTVIKDSPVGTIAGGTIFYARGWVPINVAAVDASAYQTVDTGGTTKNPPTFRVRAVTGLSSGYKVFLARRSSPGFALTTEFTLAAGNDSGDSTLTLSSSIPADKPPSGFVRVFDDSGNEDRYPYSSFTGAVLTLDSTTLSKNYTAGNAAYIPYMDETSSGTSVSKSLRYVSDRDVVLNVRLGSGSGKIEPFVSNFTLGDADSSVPATAISDTINNN
jgi:hypothetical protein